MPDCVGYIFDPWQAVIEHKLGGLPVCTTDEECWMKYPKYRWMLNKLDLYDKLGYDAYPHGILPKKFPIFSKPIINPNGMSYGTKILTNWTEQEYKPGHLWMDIFEGKQLSIDIVVHGGEIQWMYSMTPERDEKGSFVNWKTEMTPMEVVDVLREFVKLHLSDYTGPFCFETIGDKVIEAVPRFAAQWVDLYGTGWLDSLAGLFKAPYEWVMPDPPVIGESRVVRVDSSYADYYPLVTDWNVIKLQYSRVRSLHLPWFQNTPLRDNLDDPHSYRIAVINGKEGDPTEDVANEIREVINFLSYE